MSYPILEKIDDKEKQNENNTSSSSIQIGPENQNEDSLTRS